MIRNSDLCSSISTIPAAIDRPRNFRRVAEELESADLEAELEEELQEVIRLVQPAQASEGADSEVVVVATAAPVHSPMRCPGERRYHAMHRRTALWWRWM